MDKSILLNAVKNDGEAGFDLFSLSDESEVTEVMKNKMNETEFEDAVDFQVQMKWDNYSNMIDGLVDFILANFKTSDSHLFHILRKFNRKKHQEFGLKSVLDRCDACSELFTHLVTLWMETEGRQEVKRRETMVHVEALRSLTQVSNVEMNGALNILFNELIVMIRMGKTVGVIHQRLMDYFCLFIRFFKYEVQGIDLGFSTMRLL